MNDLLRTLFHAALEWVGQKIAQCVSGRGEEEKEKGKDMAMGESGKACRREPRQRVEEDKAYRQLDGYSYEQYG